MRYSESIYSAAEAELKKRRERAEELAQIRHKEVSAKYPELNIIENAMKTAVLETIRNLGKSGGTAVAELAKRSLEAQEERKLLLKAAGYPEDYLEPQYSCKRCNDTGLIDGKLCSCQLDILKQVALSSLSCSSALATSTFKTFDLKYYSDKKDAELGCSPRDYMRGAFEMIKAYAEGFEKDGDSLFFCGATGLGKTHLSLAVMNTVVKNGFNVYYGSAGSILKEMEKEHFGKSNENIEEEIGDADLLIIDDLGTEFENAFSKSAVYELLNDAILNGKPLIINTNLTKAELEARYGERVASRLNSFEVVNFCGTDIRQLKK